MGRFDFIKQKDSNLYSLCLQAEKRMNDDTDIFMLKCRKALECIVTIAGCRGRNLYEKVDDINNNLKISREMKHQIFAFKDMCNESIHYDTEEKDIDTLSMVSKLESICHWLVDAIIDKQVDKVISDNVEILAEKTKELQKAFSRNDYAAVEKLTEEIKSLSQKQKKDISSIKNSDSKTESAPKIIRMPFFNTSSSSQTNNEPSSTASPSTNSYTYTPPKPSDFAVNFRRENNNNYTDEDVKDIYNSIKHTVNSRIKKELIDKLRSAASQGNIKAKIYIIDILYDGIYAPKNHVLVLQYATELALKSNAKMQELLGDMYYNGQGTLANCYTALDWYKKAAFLGSESANEKAKTIIHTYLHLSADKNCYNCINYIENHCIKKCFEDTCSEFKAKLPSCECCSYYQNGKCNLFKLRKDWSVTATNYLCYKFEYHKGRY